MKRWDFFTGLTVVLCLLIIMGGFSVWTTQALTADLGKQIASNYDTVRALRELHTASTRINAVALTVGDPVTLQNHTSTYEHQRALIRREMEVVNGAISEPGEAEEVARLEALLTDYLQGLDVLFAAPTIDREKFVERQAVLGRKAAEIAEVSLRIVTLNERAMFERRDRLVLRGQRVNYVALGLVLMSLGIYVYTSYRLTQGVYQPLIRLRDSIVALRENKFSQFVPVDGGEEIGQIAENFNAMATDLRAFISEKDERVVAANRLSRSILHTLPNPVYIVDNAQEVILMNPQAERLSAGLGVPGRLPAVLRQRVDAAAAAGRDVVADEMREAIELDYEEPEVRSGKAAYLPQVFRMTTDLGAPEGWAVLLMDVTNLRRLDAAKSKAISTLGHEVKTPVTGIRMTLHLLLEEKIGPLTADQRELIESGRGDCERLLTVLQALLELARLESGREALNLEAVEAERLVMEADAMHGSWGRQTGRAIVVEPLPEGLPRVVADTTQAGRVLGNFLSNAMKYGLPGEPVVLRASGRADGHVRFSVINRSARALTELEQARVFEPFYRRSGETVEGSGLGLTIAREMAALQGGRIGVWSQEDMVEFYFDLPVERATAEA